MEVREYLSAIDEERLIAAGWYVERYKANGTERVFMVGPCVAHEKPYELGKE